MATNTNIILVVGATGNLGGRVVKALLAQGRRVRALARRGTDPSSLAAQGVEIIRGDMLDPASLEQAMDGVSALVTTAIGYLRRRKGDSLATVDDRGNRNLVDAARAAKLEWNTSPAARTLPTRHCRPTSLVLCPPSRRRYAAIWRHLDSVRKQCRTRGM